MIDGAYWRDFENGVVVAAPDGVKVSFDNMYVDISTGEVYLTEEWENIFKFLESEIARQPIGELLVNEGGQKILKEKRVGGAFKPR